MYNKRLKKVITITVIIRLVFSSTVAIKYIEKVIEFIYLFINYTLFIFLTIETVKDIFKFNQTPVTTKR